jgi:DNA-binding MarR family transcriptional regulator
MNEQDTFRVLGQSFKHTMAALRRMRSAEHRLPGELRDAQYGLLFCLRERDQLPTHELALAGDLSPASATELLDELESAGLVERTRSSSDRRVVLTSLTERGRALVEERRASVEPRFRAALAEFTDRQLLTAASVLDAMGAMFDELAEERRAAAAAPIADPELADPSNPGSPAPLAA